MKDIIAKRIKSARTLAGYSLRELSEKMEGIVSHTAIKKYEEGKMMPESKVLLALSKALNVKTDYLFKPFEVNIENIEFRKRSKLLVKEINAIKEKVIDSISNNIELEQFLNMSSLFVNPIQDVLISNGDDVELAVNKLLVSWKLGFNALHELAHLLLVFSNELEPKQKEKLFHRFAGAMLMPKETFLQELGRYRTQISIPELVALKETYGISIQAIMARAKDLEVITEEKFIRFRVWINQDETRRKEIGLGAFIGREQSVRFKYLLFRAASEELISMSKAANMANQKLAAFRDEFVEI